MSLEGVKLYTGRSAKESVEMQCARPRGKTIFWHLVMSGIAAVNMEVSFVVCLTSLFPEFRDVHFRRMQFFRAPANGGGSLVKTC